MQAGIAPYYVIQLQVIHSGKQTPNSQFAVPSFSLLSLPDQLCYNAIFHYSIFFLFFDNSYKLHVTWVANTIINKEKESLHYVATICFSLLLFCDDFLSIP